MVIFQQQFLCYEDAEQHQNAVSKALVGNEIFIQDKVTVSPIYVDEDSHTWWFNIVVGDCNGHDVSIIDETPSLFKMMQ